jgi:hypothetical protein
MTDSSCKQAFRSHPDCALRLRVRGRVPAAATSRAWTECAFNRVIQTSMASDEASGRLLSAEGDS